MKKLAFVFVLFLCPLLWAQSQQRTYESHKEENGVFEVTTSDGYYRFVLYSNAIMETSFVPKGEQYNPDSHAVVLKPRGTKANYEYRGKVIRYGSDDLRVHITTKPFGVAYYYKGQLLVSEKDGYLRSKHVPMDLVKGNIVADTTEKLSFNITQNEVLYGGGARALGMNRRGHRLPLFNRAHYGYQTHSELMNFTLPLVVSSKKYMLHFDNAPIGYLDLDSKKTNTLTYETISGRKTYQVIAGNSWYDLMDNYTDLTGKQPMPPRWAFGNFSSRFGYHTDKETEATIAKFKEEKIPVDAVILDLYWFGKEVKGTMGNLAVYRDSFPDMEGMVARLNKQDVKTILITEPFVLTTSKRWEEAVKEEVLAKNDKGEPYTYDFYFGNTGIIDVYSQKGARWFWQRYKEIIDMGVAGIWGDLGEPEVHPADILHATGTGAEVHNTYGHDWARLVYQGYLRHYPTQRPFILMRAGYSGSQRYGLIPWSGDVSRSWGGLQSQPEIALQMGMQGLAYMHSDLGGFAGANLDDELYARWLQYGVFQPIYRPHAQEDVPSEPVFRSEKAKSLAKQAIELRYKLLPYNYHIAFVNSTSGTPLMRSLIFEEVTNEQLNSISSTYLWGPDFLISPVLKQGQKTVDVYFPATGNWFDFYTGTKISGGQKRSIPTKESSIPTYVKGGAFVLMAPPMQTTEAYDASKLELHYYHDKDVIESEREFYNDDGKTPNAHAIGQYEMLVFEAEMKKDILEIDFESKNGRNWNFNTKHIELVVHNVSWDIQWIKVNGKKVPLNKQNNTLSIPVEWFTKKEAKIKIKRK